HDPQLAYVGERLRPLRQFRRDAAPVRDRVVVEDVAGAIDELLVLVERELRVLGMGMRGEKRPAPGHLAAVDPLPALVRERSLGGDQTLVPEWVGAGERARVRLRPDRHLRVQEVELAPLDRRDERELLLGAL